MDKKSILATKAYKYIYLHLMGIGLILIFLIPIISLYIHCKGDYIDDREDIMIIMMVILGGFILFSLIKIILFLLKPKNIIEQDSYGIYLNYTKRKAVYILSKDIENVSRENIKSRYHTFDFGNIIIETKYKKYKIGVINNVNEIEKIIYSLIRYKLYKCK